jgi:hypothetical protein
MHKIRRAVILLVLSALPAVLAAQAGTVQFSSANYTTQEGDGAVLITLTRTGGSNGVATVEVFATGGTADGTDYFIPPRCVGPPCPPITWEDGDSAPKIFDVIITDDALGEPAETVTLSLFDSQGATTIGNPGSATLVILDNEGVAVIPTLSETAQLLLICVFGAAGAWLLRRPSRASGEEREKGGGTPEDLAPHR